MREKVLRPSLQAHNPKDVRYGEGQYLSDIKPGTKRPGQLSYIFLNIPFQGRRFTHYIGINVVGLNVLEGRKHVFVVFEPGDARYLQPDRVTWPKRMRIEMEYVLVKWNHNFEDMPTEIYSEIDSRRMEVRKVEVFRNGRVGYAAEHESKWGTQLGLEPLPTLADISSQPEFLARSGSKAEFDALWTKATGRSSAA